MIPVSVAGTGLYYTRWQQNVNDLKTMIDLVSDDKPERQKYGIAMFEYLLKNDKVPVEFVAAQLDYANNASDPQLLPAMDRAALLALLAVRGAEVPAGRRRPLGRHRVQRLAPGSPADRTLAASSLGILHIRAGPVRCLPRQRQPLAMQGRTTWLGHDWRPHRTLKE